MSKRSKRKKAGGGAARAEDSSARGGGSDPRSDGPPLWVPMVAFAVLTVVLFRDFVFSRQMLFGGDTLSLGYMARAFYADAVRATGFPEWNPVILGGTPFLESLAGGDSLYPTALLLFLLEPYRALGWKLVIHVFLAGVFMYGWIRALGLGRTAATLAGIAYLVAPFFVTLVYPGHDGKLFVTALTPLAFWAAERSLCSPGLRGLVALAAVVGLVILTTHFQAAYFLFGSLGAYMVFRVVQVGRVRGRWGLAGGRYALFLFAALVGAGVGAVQLLPAVDYVTEFSRRTATTTRADAAEGIAYSSSWSLHPEEAMSLIVPEFVGSTLQAGAPWTEGTYWGRNALKYNHEYAGLAVLLLAAMSFIGAPRKGVRLFFAGLGIVALLFGLGTHTPVWRIFYEVVPGISLFRAPSIAIFVFGFSAITLAAFGVDRLGTLVRGGEGSSRSAERLLWGGAGVLLLLTLLASSGVLRAVWSAVLYPDMSERAAAALEVAWPFIVRGFVLSTLIAAALAGLASLSLRARIPPWGLAVGLGALLAFDGLRVDSSFIQTFDFDAWARPDANIQYLLERQATEPPFRVLSMLDRVGQDVKPGMYGLELAGGHHPNDLQRYRELIGMVGGGAPENLLRSPALLSLLNVRYLLWPEAAFGGPPFQGAQPVSATSIQDGRIFDAVYEIPALPRARLVSDVTVVEEDGAVDFMLAQGFDPEASVVLEAPLSSTLPGGPVEGSVEWMEREPDRAVLDVVSDRAALLVVADNWFPDWRATVDQAEVPVLRAFHTLRAIPVPAGRSRVELTYRSSAVRRGLRISLISALLLAVGLAGAALLGRRRAEHGG